MTQPQYLPPSPLFGHAAAAWNAAIASIGPFRSLTQADLLAIEGACRAWARYRAIEERIEATANGNVLAGEVSKAPNGRLEVSALRKAANEAMAAFVDTAKAYGLTFPGIDAAAEEGDLFGYPDRPGRGRKGRPPFRPTLRDRNRVRLLLALGWSNKRIAEALETTEKTLRKYFSVELKERDLMRDRLDARRFELAMMGANAGNITALKELGRMIDRSDMMVAESRVGKAEEEPATSERLGKKEMRALDAEDAEERLSREIE